MSNLNALLNRLSSTATVTTTVKPVVVTVSGWATICKAKAEQEIAAERSTDLNRAIRAEMEKVGLITKEEVTDVTDEQAWALEGWLIGQLGRKTELTRVQVISIAAIVKEIAKELKYDGISFAEQLVDAIQGIRLHDTEGLVSDVTLSPEDVFNALTKVKFIEISEEGEVRAGKGFWKSISTKKSRMPEEYGTLERLHGSIKNVSVLTRDAIYALEDTKFNISSEFLEFIGYVYESLEGHEKEEAILRFFKQYEYILKGCMGMDSNTDYVSEFFEDWRAGRLYQANNYGPNSQASDFGRAVQSFHTVSTDYDDNKVLDLLYHELEDMCSVSGLELEELVEDVREDEVQFFLHHFYDEATNVENKSPVKKLMSFIRYAKVVNLIKLGVKPVIDVLVGLDAKGSGPQLGGLMFADVGMLALTGFSDKAMEDVYTNCINILETKYGIMNVTRTQMKKPFMAVFYGAGLGAMMQHDKVEDIVHIYEGLEGDAKLKRAKDLRDAILESFGGKIKQAMSRIKWAGTDFNTKECKLNKHLSVKTVDGGCINFDYNFFEDIHGNILEGDEKGCGFTLEFNDVKRWYKTGTYETNIPDYASDARTGFVNLIQHADSVLAKLIIVKLKDLGVDNIVSVHDCFRVDIHSMDKLYEAISWAYTTLFGNPKNEKSYYLPNGTDIVGLFFDAIEDATKDEWKKDLRPLSQFKTFGNKSRNLMHVEGKTPKHIFSNLGNGYDFFSK